LTRPRQAGQAAEPTSPDLTLPPGAQKIAKLLKEGKNGQAQHLATGFTTFVNILTHGASQQQVVHVRPGFWVLACFMDTQDGREHTRLGMERVIDITK
jgi:hypothetical protein